MTMSTHRPREGTRLPHVRTDGHPIRGNGLDQRAQEVILGAEGSERLETVIEIEDDGGRRCVTEQGRVCHEGGRRVERQRIQKKLTEWPRPRAATR